MLPARLRRVCGKPVAGIFLLRHICGDRRPSGRRHRKCERLYWNPSRNGRSLRSLFYRLVQVVTMMWNALSRLRLTLLMRLALLMTTGVILLLAAVPPAQAAEPSA